MTTEKNNVSFNFRSYNEERDTDIDVNICGDNADDQKLCKLLNTFLKAIDSTCEVTWTSK
jgi:S-adenosylmethionine/arginine decarboxylase-like enzyme